MHPGPRSAAVRSGPTPPRRLVEGAGRGAGPRLPPAPPGPAASARGGQGRWLCCGGARVCRRLRPGSSRAVRSVRRDGPPCARPCAHLRSSALFFLLGRHTLVLLSFPVSGYCRPHADVTLAVGACGTRAVFIHVRKVGVATDLVSTPAAQVIPFLWGGMQINLEISCLDLNCLYFNVSPRAAECLRLCPSVRRQSAGARHPAGARRRGAEPDAPPGGGGAGVRERVAGPGQCVLTRPVPTSKAVSEVKCGEERSPWNSCSETSSVKDVTMLVCWL